MARVPLLASAETLIKAAKFCLRAGMVRAATIKRHNYEYLQQSYNELMSTSKAGDLAETLRNVTLYMRRHVDAAMSAQGLSLARAKLLSHMEKEGPSRPGSLAAQLGQAPRTLTDALDALVRDGLAERKPHPTDRRALLVSVTSRGIKALRAIEEPKRHALEEIFRPLSTVQQENLLTSLQTILQTR